MSDEPLPQSEIILYQTEDGRTRVQCRFENETLWLTQAQIAELFQTTPQNVTLHLKAIFAEGELAEAATCKDYLQVRREGRREVSRSLRHYRLEAILAVVHVVEEDVIALIAPAHHVIYSPGIFDSHLARHDAHGLFQSNPRVKPASEKYMV